MEKQRFKILLGLFVFTLLMFGSFKYASAITIIDQENVNGFIVSDCNAGAGTDQCWDSSTSSPIGFGSHNFGGFELSNMASTTSAGWPGAVRLLLAKRYPANIKLTLSCYNGISTQAVTSDNSLDTNSLSTSAFSEVEFDFSIPNTCDFPGYGVYALGFDSFRDSVLVAGTNVPNASYPHLGVGDPFTGGGPNLSYQPWLQLSDQAGLPVRSGGATAATPSNPIIFQNPPFYQNFKTASDFLNWSTCVYLDASSTASVLDDGYFIKVSYGTTTNWSMNDYTLQSDPGGTASSTLQGYYQIYRLPTNLCQQTTKDNLASNVGIPTSTIFSSLPPGSYLAQAGLYETDFTSSPRFIASSSVLSFIIQGAGPPTSLPSNSGNVSPGTICIPTSFSIFGIDYGRGICSTVSYLFYPSQDSLNTFSGLWDTVKPKPPFGWFTVSESVLSGVSTSTAPTTTLMSLSLISVFLNPADYMLAFLVLLSFLLFLWHRFAKFNFHQ